MNNMFQQLFRLYVLPLNIKKQCNCMSIQNIAFCRVPIDYPVYIYGYDKQNLLIIVRLLVN
jgi:hypothetical protein